MCLDGVDRFRRILLATCWCSLQFERRRPFKRDRTVWSRLSRPGNCSLRDRRTWSTPFTRSLLLSSVISRADTARFLQKITFYACNTLFVVIAVDLYIAIVYPLQYDTVVTEARINCANGTSSLVASAVGIVELLWLLNISWSSCNLPYSITMHYAFDLVFYIFGASLLVFVYGRIFLIALEHRRRIDQSPVLRPTVPSGGISVIEQSSTMNTAQQTESQSGRTKSTKSQLRAARMTGIVIGSYSISWLPYFIGKGLQFSGNRAQYVQNLIDVGSALGTASVCLNWVIYGMTSRIFRKAFLRILCKRHKRVVENSRSIPHN